MTRRAPLVAIVVALVAVAGCAANHAPALPPPTATPHFPDFVFPAIPGQIANPAIGALHELGWQWLQAGDAKAAERNFTAALRQSPGFYPSEAGLGYAALARRDNKEAASHFDRALAASPSYAPALAGRGEALLALGQRDQALTSFEAAVAANPQLSALRSRIEVLRFRGLQDDVDAARKAAEAGRLQDARTLYERTIAASPDSPFLYRELAIVEKREGNLPRALEHAEKAAALNAAEPRNFTTIGEIYEAQSEYGKALDAYASAIALEPSEALESKVDDLRARAAFAAMPQEYRGIESSPTVTRAQLAALFGVRLEDLLKRAPRSNSIVITDTRGSWAAPWILSTARAGIMEVYPNHTFLPNAVARRGDLAQAASQVLSLIAASNPRVAASLKNARGRFADISPGHLSYHAASVVVETGVMTPTADGSFQLSRPVTGQEAVAAVNKLVELSGRQSR
jgi:tetratricopeptide (TPR) repeat protein